MTVIYSFGSDGSSGSGGSSGICVDSVNDGDVDSCFSIIGYIGGGGGVAGSISSFVIDSFISWNIGGGGVAMTAVVALALTVLLVWGQPRLKRLSHIAREPLCKKYNIFL